MTAASETPPAPTTGTDTTGPDDWHETFSARDREELTFRLLGGTRAEIVRDFVIVDCRPGSIGTDDRRLTEVQSPVAAFEWIADLCDKSWFTTAHAQDLIRVLLGHFRKGWT